MAVRADQQVAGRVGIEVEDRVRQVAAMHDQSFAVVARLDGTEGTLLLFGGGRLVLTLDVDHPVRSPQPLESVGSARMSGWILKSAGICGHQTCRRAAMSPLISLIAASMGTPFFCRRS